MNEQIKREGFLFNMQCLSEKYAAGKLCLMRTETWLGRHVMRGNRPLLQEGNPASYVALHLNATIELAIERRKISRDLVPELYENDAHRLLKFQNEFYLLIVSMAILKIGDDACNRNEEKIGVRDSFCFLCLAADMTGSTRQL